MYEQYHLKAKIPKALWISTEAVVEQSLKALKRDRVICIPGFENRVIITYARIGLTPLLAKMLENRLRP